MAFQKRLKKDTEAMRKSGLDPIIVAEEHDGFAAEIMVISANGDVHVFMLPPQFPFKMPYHIINGIVDRSFVPVTGSTSNYTGLPYGMEPSRWSPATRLEMMLYNPRLSVKKLSDITAKDIGKPHHIIVNVGYCNSMSGTTPGYPHRYISGENDPEDLHILIDPRDQPHFISESMNKEGITGRVIHSKLLPLGDVGADSEFDEKFYQAHYKDTDREADRKWFINMMKEHHEKVIITDSMYFYGNPMLTCPPWFRNVLQKHPPKSYVGYDTKDNVIVYHEKCME